MILENEKSRANDFNRSSEKLSFFFAKPGSRQKANRFPEMGNFFIIPISVRDLFLYRYKFVHDPTASNYYSRIKQPRLKICMLFAHHQMSTSYAVFHFHK